MRNGHLDHSEGWVSKQQAFDALLHVGISRKVAMETTDANFDHLPGEKVLNVFCMNTIKEAWATPDPPGPLEHFRSTGIRDGLEPDGGPTAYGVFEACAAYDGPQGPRSMHAVSLLNGNT